MALFSLQLKQCIANKVKHIVLVRLGGVMGGDGRGSKEQARPQTETG